MNSHLETFVEWKSLQFHRVSNRYYINCNGSMYKLSKEEADALRAELDRQQLDNPMTAAEWIETQITNYKLA